MFFLCLLYIQYLLMLYLERFSECGCIASIVRSTLYMAGAKAFTKLCTKLRRMHTMKMTPTNSRHNTDEDQINDACCLPSYCSFNVFEFLYYFVDGSSSKNGKYCLFFFNIIFQNVCSCCTYIIFICIL